MYENERHLAMTPVAAALGMHFHAIIHFQADITFMYISLSQKQTVHEHVQCSILMQRQKKLRSRTETTPCSSFDSQTVMASTLTIPVLFTDKPPPFDSVRACGSGINTTSESFSFCISSTLLLRTATAFFDHHTLCKEFTQKKRKN